MTVSISIQYAFWSSSISCSRSSCMSLLRMPCRGVVLGVLIGITYPRVACVVVESPTVPEPLWRRIRADPGRAPEHIALAAAERFGPAAEEWIRVAGGGHTPESLARTAFRKHVRLARLEGAALGLGGVYTAAPDLLAL